MDNVIWLILNIYSSFYLSEQIFDILYWLILNLYLFIYLFLFVCLFVVVVFCQYRYWI